MKLFFVKEKKEQKKCLKIIGAFKWERKGNKQRKNLSFKSLLCLIQGKPWFQWATFPETGTSTLVLLGHLMGHSDAVCAYPASASLQVSLSILIKITTLQETSSAGTFLQYIWLTKKASFIWKIALGTPDRLCSTELEGHDFRVKKASSANCLTSRAHTTSQLLKPNKKSGRMTVESFGTNQVALGKMQFVCLLQLLGI